MLEGWLSFSCKWLNALTWLKDRNAFDLKQRAFTNNTNEVDFEHLTMWNHTKDAGPIVHTISNTWHVAATGIAAPTNAWAFGMQMNYTASWDT